MLTIRHEVAPVRHPKNSRCEMPRYRAVLSGIHMLARRDRTGWLGRQDSNLRMSRFDPFPISLRYRKDFAELTVDVVAIIGLAAIFFGHRIGTR
jgi:hypothetical protein